jgi:hypothetical protein
VNGLRRLANAAAAAVAPAAIIIDAAVLGELPATEIPCAKVRDLRAQLRGVAALLPPAVIVTGLAQLAAPIPAPVLASLVLAVPVGLVPARRLGLFLAQADGAQKPQGGSGCAADYETETAPGPCVELCVVQLCTSGCLHNDSASLSEYVKLSVSLGLV